MLKFCVFFVVFSVNVYSNINKSGLYLGDKKTIESSDNFTYWYFKPDKFGARAFHNPLQFIIEGGMPGGKKLNGVDLGQALVDVFEKVINPVPLINDYGWKKFFYFEFVPHSGDGSNWVPNYTWHLLGGGFRTRLMIEYYHYHNYKYPALWGWGTMYIMHFFNEATQISDFNKLESSNQENGDTENDTVDAIPDLMFFDWIGGVIFSYDPVNKFMTRYLHLSDWTYQSQYNPLTNRLLNNGQVYWMRYQLFDTPISLNFISGAKITAPGITYEFMTNHQISLGLGLSVNKILMNSNGDLVSGSKVYTFGFYYSIADNPILTVTLSLPDYKAIELNPETKNEYTTKLNINLYPSNFIKFLDMDLGLTFTYERGVYFIGISNAQWPLGFTIGNKIPEYYNK